MRANVMGYSLQRQEQRLKRDAGRALCDTDAIGTCKVLKDVSLDDAGERVVMALAVYSRVGSMLQAAGVDLKALRDEIAARCGLTIDLRRSEEHTSELQSLR